MVSLEFKVTGQKLKLLTDLAKVEQRVADTVNYYKCHFTFDSDWDNLDEITVVFKNISSNVRVSVTLSNLHTCFIPSEVLANTGVIICAVTGARVAGDSVTFQITSSPTEMFIQQGEGLIDYTLNTPTPTQYQQFVDEVKTYSTAAAVSASSASASATSAQGYASAASGSATTASTKASEAASYSATASAKADIATAAANTATTKASEASSSASSAASSASDASTSASSAETAQEAAEEAQAAAEVAEGKIEDMTVSAEGGAAGTSPSVTKTETAESFNLHFVIPKGDTGATGATGPAGAKGDKGDAGTASWNGITDKPDTFPPASHNHTKGNITDFPTGLSEFTDDLGSSPSHTHSQYLTSHQDVTGKEDHVNKVTAWSDPTTDLHYPSEKLVKNTFDIKQDIVDLSIVNGMLCVTYEEV